MDPSPEAEAAVAELNRRTMGSPRAVREYALNSALFPAEQAALEAVAAEAAGRPILDIGVGTGRTVAGLRALSADYLGIDYSARMLEEARRRHPDANLVLADARDLHAVASASKFLVMFSCGGIGMVSHQDRLRILAEIGRVLEPGGVLLFSFHNRDFLAQRPAFSWPPFSWCANPVRLAVRAGRWAGLASRGLRNRWRLKRFESASEDYALINDRYHEYETLIYYITLERQVAQLLTCGFSSEILIFDEAGERVSECPVQESVMLVARKRGTGVGAGAAG